MKEVRTVEPKENLNVIMVLNNGEVESVTIAVMKGENGEESVKLDKSETLDLLNWLEKQLGIEAPKSVAAAPIPVISPPTGKPNDSDIRNRTTGKTQGMGTQPVMDIGDMKIMDMSKPQKEVIKLTPFKIAPTGGEAR